MGSIKEGVGTWKLPFVEALFICLNEFKSLKWMIPKKKRKRKRNASSEYDEGSFELTEAKHQDLKKLNFCKCDRN